MRGRAAVAGAGVLLLTGLSVGVPARLAPEPRHEILVFFAPGHEPMTTLDVPITADAGEVGAGNLYIPGDAELFEALEALGWSAVRRSPRRGRDGGYVISFPCACERGIWWKPHILRELRRSASVDSVRDLSTRPLDGFSGPDYMPSLIETRRPDVPPDSLAGSVTVRAVIDTCGVVIRASVETTTLPPAYGDAAVAAARRWRFHPATCEPAWALRRHTDRIAAEIIIPFRFE